MAGEPKTVLLTGASVGLGLAVARRLLATEHRLILTARRSSLGRFADEGIEPSDRVRLRPLDVTNADERYAIVAEANRDWGGIDVLINNAGISYRAVVEHVHTEDALEQLRVNYLAPMELIRLVLPGMRAKRDGRILSVSSVGGMMAMPTMSVYSASKFALEGAHEALWYEVKPWGVRVSLIEPGFIRSGGFSKVRYTLDSAGAMASVDRDYHAHYRYMSGFIEWLMNRTWATPESVARRIHKAMEAKRPPLRVYATPDALVFASLRRRLPRRLYHRALYHALPGIRRWGPKQKPRKLQRPPGKTTE
jgi:short-subunit dehydrogenase